MKNNACFSGCLYIFTKSKSLCHYSEPEPVKLDVKPRAQLHFTFRLTLGPKPAGKIEKCTAEL